MTPPSSRKSKREVVINKEINMGSQGAIINSRRIVDGGYQEEY